jgi:hypothetical protein
MDIHTKLSLAFATGTLILGWWLRGMRERSKIQKWEALLARLSIKTSTDGDEG